MGVSIEEYRQRIGCFIRVGTILSSYTGGNTGHTLPTLTKDFGTVLRVIIRLSCLVVLVTAVNQTYPFALDLTEFGDVEKNPGPNSACIQEKANGTRLSRLLVDKGTEAIRKTFDNIHPPATLAAVLKANSKKLLRLKFRVINIKQWDLLYPASGSPASKTFDVTLLTVLLRNICSLSKPSSGWDMMPPDTDRSVEANIARIRCFRNEVYAHVTMTDVEDVHFSNLWEKISKALVDLGIPQNEIDFVNNCYLSPEEELYVQRLKEWKQNDDECKGMLDQIFSEMQVSKRVAAETQRDVKETQRDVKETEICGVEILKKIEAFEDNMTNHFQGSNCKVKKNEEILQQLAKHNFKGEIRGFVQLFQNDTRVWLFAQLDNWFADLLSRVMILTAGPGVGKSVFSGKVCQVYKETGNLAACHFCKFNDSNLKNPKKMLQSLASQMCDNVEGFREKLLEQLKRPHEVNSLTDAFRIYLNDPLQHLEAEQPMLIVIDGLDESSSDGKSELIELIAEEFSKLPEWIKILVTSRPEIPVKKKLDHLNPFEILPDNKDNESDLQQYLEFCLPSISDKSKISLLVKKCEGSFLFAFHVQVELLKRGNLTNLSYDEMEIFLPMGIGSVYHKYFARLEKELKTVNKDLDMLRLLEILVAAGGPLPLKVIAEVLGMSADSRAMKEIIRQVNDSLSALLYVCDDLVTVFHKSVVDWLTSNGYDEHSYTVKCGDGNELLWQVCKKEFEEIKENSLDLKLTNAIKYSLDHGFLHLFAANRKSFSESDIAWLVDMVIVHIVSVEYPANTDGLKAIWKETLKLLGCVGSQLRMKISWHFLKSGVGKIGYGSYLESVINSSPDACFNDEDKRTARKLLKIFIWSEKLNASCKENKNQLMARLFSTDVMCIGLSSEKKLVAVGQHDETISILQLPELIDVCQFSCGFSVPCCEFSPDNSLLVYGKLDCCFDVKAKQERSFFRGNNERYSSCAFSPSYQRLVTSNGSNTLKLWDITEQSFLASLPGSCPMDCCSFSESGLFITGNSKKPCSWSCETWDSLHIWNTITLQRVDQRNTVIEKDKSNASPGRLVRRDKCDHETTRDIIVATNINDFDVYDLSSQPFPTARFDHSLSDDFCLSTASYNGSNCIVAFNDESVTMLDPLHFETLAIYDLLNVYPSFDNQYREKRNLTAIDQDSFLYNDSEYLIVLNVQPDEQRSASSTRSIVACCSFSPDGSRLATCTTDCFINVWNVHKCQVVQRFPWCGRQPAACWWTKGLLWIFCFVECKPVLSRYSVDHQLKINDLVEGKYFPIECAVEIILSFSEGVFIFKSSNNETKVLIMIHGSEVPLLINLPNSEDMDSAEVSTDGGFILLTGNGWWQIWRRKTKSSWEYEMWKENKYSNHYRDLSNVDVSYFNSCCDITSDGKFGMICCKARLIQHECYFDDEYSDDLPPFDNEHEAFYGKHPMMICIVVNMESGKITNSDFDELIRLNYRLIYREERSDINIFSIQSFFVTRCDHYDSSTVCVFDIQSGRYHALYSDAISRVQNQGESFQTMAFFKEDNVIAILRNKGRVDFFKIHIPE